MGGKDAVVQHEIDATPRSQRTIFCWHEQVRVEIEALEMGLTGPSGGDPGGIGVAPEAKDASSGPGRGGACVRILPNGIRLRGRRSPMISSPSSETL